jgi:hypothetical protein
LSRGRTRISGFRVVLQSNGTIFLKIKNRNAIAWNSILIWRLNCVTRMSNVLFGSSLYRSNSGMLRYTIVQWIVLTRMIQVPARACPEAGHGFPQVIYVMVVLFSMIWGDCSCCWYLWNCWSQLFFHN